MPAPSARSHPLPRLLGTMRAHRPTLAAAALCSVLNKVFDLAPPVLIGAAVDVVVSRQDSFLAGMGVASVDAQLVWLAWITVLVWGLESLFEYAYGVLWRNLAQRLQHELRLDVYAHIQDLDMAYFEDRSLGGLMAILNDDVNQLERFFDDGANQLLQIGTTVVVVGAAFFAAAPRVAVLAVLPVPLILAGSFWFQRRIAPRYAAVRERVGLLGAQLADNLAGIATIKSYTAEEHEVGRIRAESEGYLEANRRAIALSSSFSPLIRMAIVIGFTATLLVGGRMVLAGELAVGIYSVLVFLTQRLLWPLTRLGRTVDLYQRAMASATRALDLLDTPVGIRSGALPLDRESVVGELELCEVTFGYGEGEPILRDFSLRVPAGTTLGVVGATGAGKSTLAKLLLRFRDPLAGSVRLDGRDLRELDLRSLRGAIGLVSQEVFLFPGTVRENIAYGRPGADDAAVEEAARLAEAHDFIRELPQEYATRVGERGQKLSGGQRQRLALARAFLKDPPVLLLDEATSAVDNETEAAIQRSLERMSEGRTLVVIAHRLSTVRRADRIVVLEKGRIAEQGTHDALLSLGGIYAALWRVQTGEREEESE